MINHSRTGLLFINFSVGLPYVFFWLVLQIIFGNRWRHLLGERDFWEHVGGIDVSLAPSSFGQANTRVEVLMKDTSVSYLFDGIYFQLSPLIFQLLVALYYLGTFQALVAQI